MRNRLVIDSACKQIEISERMAEREGFEPPVRFPVHLISRESQSRDRRIPKHKFPEDSNYPLPSLLLIPAHSCEQVFHNSFTVIVHNQGEGQSMSESDFGTCPTGQHITDFRQCGFAGCVDLQPLAKVKRWKYRLEESYEAESASHVRGDGRWFVEILCQHGLIYPCGGSYLLAYAKAGTVKHLINLDLDVYQTDGTAACSSFTWIGWTK
jgi:hypothetical protein